MEILFLIKVLNHKNYEFNPLVFICGTAEIMFTICEDQLSCGAVKLRLRYHSGSTSNTTLRSHCPGSNYALKAMIPPTSLHAQNWNSST